MPSEIALDFVCFLLVNLSHQLFGEQLTQKNRKTLKESIVL